MIRQSILQSTGTVLLPDFLPAFVTRRSKTSVSAFADCDLWTNRSKVSLDDDETINELIDRHYRDSDGTMYDRVVDDVEKRLISKILEIVSRKPN